MIVVFKGTATWYNMHVLIGLPRTDPYQIVYIKLMILMLSYVHSLVVIGSRIIH